MLKKLYYGCLDRSTPCLRSWAPVPRWTTGHGLPTTDPLRLFRLDKWEMAMEPFVATWWNGLRIEVRPREELSRCLYVQGSYEPNQIYFLLNTLRPGDTFLDVGAHTGVYSMIAAKQVGQRGRVIAVEPSRREFERLVSHLRLNRLANVNAVNAALSDREGEAELKVAGEPYTGHNTLGHFAYEETWLERIEKVKTATMDSLTAALDLTRLDMIKIDVEGSEMAILHGAENTLKRYRPALLFENPDKPSSPKNEQAEKVWALLKQAGYRLHAYGLDTGTVIPCDDYPGPEFTDFVATPL